MHLDTDLQHHGEDPQAQHGAVAPAVYRSSLFVFPDSASLEAALRGGGERYLYSRVSNPTVRMLEEKVALLEGADEALAFASGMGAVSAVLLTFLGAGDHLVLSAGAYGPTLTFARDVLERFGVEVSRVPAAEVSAIERHFRPRTRLVYLESPASLTFEVADLEAAARAAKARGITTVADNSWATPLYQQPLRLGLDLSLHSGTKYLSGHSDILLGVVAGRREPMARLKRAATLLGASLSPEDAFLAIRGLRTLPLRMARHQESAFLLARRLLVHPRVEKILHPALCYFPSHTLWQRQLTGSSGLFSFILRGDARRFADSLRLFSLGVSWGGHESLVLPAAVLGELDPEKGTRTDVPANLVRLSVGLEDPEDLWADLERGFAALA
jgi:cystathionine beta-lyase